MGRQAKDNFRENFIKCSFDYLVKNGLENTSVRDLCKVNGISSGNLYYWFEGKDEIYISAAKYGLSKVAGYLFSNAFGALRENRNFKSFFDNALGYFDNVKHELRFIYQVATSPVYGERMRNKAEDLNKTYEKYILELSEMINCPVEELTPVVFLFISSLLDYVVWEDKIVSTMQLEYLYGILESYTKKIANDKEETK